MHWTCWDISMWCGVIIWLGVTALQKNVFFGLCFFYIPEAENGGLRRVWNPHWFWNPRSSENCFYINLNSIHVIRAEKKRADILPQIHYCFWFCHLCMFTYCSCYWNFQTLRQCTQKLSWIYICVFMWCGVIIWLGVTALQKNVFFGLCFFYIPEAENGGLRRVWNPHWFWNPRSSENCFYINLNSIHVIRAEKKRADILPQIHYCFWFCHLCMFTYCSCYWNFQTLRQCTQKLSWIYICVFMWCGVIIWLGVTALQTQTTAWQPTLLGTL